MNKTTKKIIILILSIFLFSNPVLSIELQTVSSLSVKNEFKEHKTDIFVPQLKKVDRHLAPLSIFKASTETEHQSNTTLGQKALRILWKGSSKIAKLTFGAGLIGGAIFSIGLLLNNNLHDIEHQTALIFSIPVFLGAGLTIISLLKAFKAFGSSFQKAIQIAWTVLLVTLGAEAAVIPGILKGFIPVNSIENFYKSSRDTDISDKDLNALLGELYDNEYGCYVFGFQNKDDLARFIDHNKLLWLSVKNHYTPDGQIPEDPNGIIRARFLKLAWEATKTSFPVLHDQREKMNNPINIVTSKSMLSFILIHSSLLRMNILETPVRDKMGMSPGIGHISGPTIISNLELANLLSQWSQTESNDFPPQLLAKSWFIREIEKKHPHLKPIYKGIWADYYASSPDNQNLNQVYKIKGTLIPEDSMTLIGNIGRLNPFLEPEFSDSLAYDDEAYSLENLGTDLSKEGAYWSLRGRLANMYGTYGILWNQMLNSSKQRHKVPGLMFKFSLSYSTSGAMENFLNGEEISPFEWDETKLVESMPLPENHSRYVLEELTKGEGPLFTPEDMKIIILPSAQAELTHSKTKAFGKAV